MDCEWTPWARLRSSLEKERKKSSATWTWCLRLIMWLLLLFSFDHHHHQNSDTSRWKERYLFLQLRLAPTGYAGCFKKLNLYLHNNISLCFLSKEAAEEEESESVRRWEFLILHNTDQLVFVYLYSSSFRRQSRYYFNCFRVFRNYLWAFIIIIIQQVLSFNHTYNLIVIICIWIKTPDIRRRLFFLLWILVGDLLAKYSQFLRRTCLSIINIIISHPSIPSSSPTYIDAISEDSSAIEEHNKTEQEGAEGLAANLHEELSKKYVPVCFNKVKQCITRSNSTVRMLIK